MFERLKKLGINGLLFRNIEAMYQKTEYLTKYKNGHLDPIISNVGLKQGCPLSPMLFNLYIDDVINIFDEKCDPVIFQEKALSHFMYADDLVLLSSSETGLQICLDRLQNFSGNKGCWLFNRKNQLKIIRARFLYLERILVAGIKGVC